MSRRPEIVVSAVPSPRPSCPVAAKSTVAPKRLARATPSVVPAPARRQLSVRWWLVWCAVVTLAYSKPLLGLLTFAAASPLYSHILLVPLVSFYLIWIRRRSLPATDARSPRLALLPLALGVFAVAAYAWLKRSGRPLNPADALSLLIGSYACLSLSATLAFLGLGLVRRLLFPLAFLLFMIPLPTAFTSGIEVFLQHASAQMAFVMLEAARTPMVHDGLVFRLPGITITVSQECSGIHSSLVLFILSLLAGQLFLVSPWKKALLALVVIPLAILRNAFRIFTLAMLCVHSDPAWIHSPLHHRGGPIFFALSLIPFLVLLAWLRRTEPSTGGRVEAPLPGAPRNPPGATAVDAAPPPVS